MIFRLGVKFFFRKKTFPTKIFFCIYLLGQYARLQYASDAQKDRNPAQLPMDPIIETEDLLPTYSDTS
jgi:hypothetical protein